MVHPANAYPYNVLNGNNGSQRVYYNVHWITDAFLLLHIIMVHPANALPWSYNVLLIYCNGKQGQSERLLYPMFGSLILMGILWLG